MTYEKVREASAQLKRNSEASLRDFMLRTHPSTSVFSAFEQRMREEARQILEETKRQQKARLIARQTQIETERLNEELKQGQDDEMPELFESAEADDPKSNSELENSTSGHMNDILAENLFVLGESEHSLLRRRLPAICQS
ncbi:unnamed protein product [Anisakis simplex]|uniref:Uncharacterized protein n=1 Tax=Anisakis simplex TaxID=6269 RepID=A0A3P6NKX4_ANISI|nr:unnamed protein product [Anisakis simplex]